MKFVTDALYVVLLLHFGRLLLRAVGMAQHQAFDSSKDDIASGLGLTKQVKKEVPDKDGVLVERMYEVRDVDKVTVWVRLRVFFAQFLVN